MEEDEYDPDVKALHWVSCHHKTTRRGFGPIAIDIPPGPLKRMLLVHITSGFDLLTRNSVSLFNSPTGKAFTDSVRGTGGIIRHAYRYTPVHHCSRFPPSTTAPIPSHRQGLHVVL